MSMLGQTPEETKQTLYAELSIIKSRMIESERKAILAKSTIGYLRNLFNHSINSFPPDEVYWDLNNTIAHLYDLIRREEQYQSSLGEHDADIRRSLETFAS